jgi:hypothetical protein
VQDLKKIHTYLGYAEIITKILFDIENVKIVKAIPVTGRGSP